MIDSKLQSGHLWKGVVRMNPKFRNRAYVSIPELDVDVLLENYRMMNRALDGDTVLIELLPVHSWIEMGD
jgi:exoribonuclease R